MQHLKKHTDVFLVALLANSNSKAFETLYKRYYNDVYAYGFSLLKSKENAEEIAQDVFLNVWKHRKKLNSKKSFKAYLFTITRNSSFNLIVKLKNSKKLKNNLLKNYNSHENVIVNNLIEQEYNQLKNKVFEQLPPRRKLIFELSRNEGLSYEDISKKLGISISTVKGQMSKSLETIKTLLRAHTDISLILILALYLFL